MIKRFQKQFNIVKGKLATIGFILEEDDDFGATFSDGSGWKISLRCERYDEGCDIRLRNIKFEDIRINRLGFSIYFIMRIFGIDPKYQPLEQDMDFIIKYKDKLFDETFPYKEKYDELNQIPDWVLHGKKE